MLDQETKEQIESDISNNKIMLYMKGTPEQPMCGFSAQVTVILQQLGAPFAARNVLEEPNIRQGIKEFSDWPTIPQLYVNGEFVGGCDIITEMANSGELQELLGNVGA